MLHSVDAFDLWYEWSMQNPRPDTYQACQSRWQRYQSGRHSDLTYKTLFLEAMEAGYMAPKIVTDVLEPNKTEPVPFKDDPDTNEYDLEDRLPPEEPIIDYEEIELPTAIPCPVPQIQGLSSYIANLSGIPEGRATQAAALSLAGTVTSRLYDHRTNMAFTLSMPTALEYNRLSDVVQEILRSSGLERLVRDRRLANCAQFYKTLYQSPVAIHLAPDWSRKLIGNSYSAGDELHPLIAQAHDAKFIKISNPEKMGIRVNRDDPDPLINVPAFNLFASAPEHDLGRLYTHEQIARGVAQLSMLVREPTCTVSAHPMPDIDPGLIRYIDIIRGIASSAGKTLSLAEIYSGNPLSKPVTRPVQWQCNQTLPDIESYQKNASPWIRALCTPLLDNIRRVATTLAAWANPYQATVTQAIWEWACDWCKVSLDNAVVAVKNCTDEDRQSDYDKVLACIARYGAKGITKGTLPVHCHAFRKLDKDAREKLLQLMLRDGALVQFEKRWIASHKVRAKKGQALPSNLMVQPEEKMAAQTRASRGERLLNPRTSTLH
jgi:hypothetical protein